VSDTASNLGCRVVPHLIFRPSPELCFFDLAPLAEQLGAALVPPLLPGLLSRADLYVGSFVLGASRIGSGGVAESQLCYTRISSLALARGNWEKASMKQFKQRLVIGMTGEGFV
jgi:hypothetical protein